MTTPKRPWRVVVKGPNVNDWAVEDATGDCLADYLDRAIADLIVAAVNEREGLREALRLFWMLAHLRFWDCVLYHVLVEYGDKCYQLGHAGTECRAGGQYLNKDGLWCGNHYQGPNGW